MKNFELRNSSPNTDIAVKEAHKLLQEAYMFQERQQLWPGIPALLQFDRRLGRITEDTPNSEQLKVIDYSSQFETLEQLSTEVETLSVKSFLNSVAKKQEIFFLIKGPPGSGKTSLLQRVCTFWARGFCLRKFTLVLWLALNTYPREPPDASLRTLLRYSLPQGSHIDSIEHWVNRYEGEGVLVIIDGVKNQGLCFIDNIVAEKRLKNATIILTASSTSVEPRYSFLHKYHTTYHLLGLSEEQFLSQVIQHYCHNTSRAEEFLLYISETHNIRALCRSPSYLATVLFVFDNMNTSDFPNSWTQLFTSLTLFLLRPSGMTDHDTLAILTSKAYAVTSTNSSFNWHHRYTNFCSKISSPYRTMVAPADHSCFTLPLLQHYLCARHIHSLPYCQHIKELNQHWVLLHVWQFYIGLCSSFKRVKLVLKYPDALMSAACISEIPVEGLQDLISSQPTYAFKDQLLTAINIHSIFQTVYHSGLPCKLQLKKCHFGPQTMEVMVKCMRLRSVLPIGGLVQELK